MFRWTLLLLLACILWLVYVIAQIGSIERNPAVVKQMATPADAGILLGAAMWGDQPSPGLEERLQLSLKDYRDGKFQVFILTGGLDRPEYRYTEAEGMAIYLEAHGVPRDKILLENKATSTYENLKFSKKIMEEHGLKTALIMTHTYHGNRALEISQMLGYSDPKLSLTETKVLKPTQKTAREILAYTKWKMDQIAIIFGWK
ncbi:YdcF family protein [Fontibacillus panacisegetis]|nr:YdcF family protein [Fontibacillus panacisegetis]